MPVDLPASCGIIGAEGQVTALLFHRKKTYGDYLVEYIGHVEAGELSFVPWVYCALSQGTDKQKAVAAQTLAQVLAGLNADGLVAMDLRMRETTSMEWSIDWRARRIEDFFAENLSPEACRAVLVFSTFHPNGYIREQAVAALRADSKALPAVLLRCNDWVAQVRQAALESLTHLLDIADGRRSPPPCPFWKSCGGVSDAGWTIYCPSFSGRFNGIPTCSRWGWRAGMSGPGGMTLSRRFLGDKYPPNRVLALEYLAEHGAEDLFQQAVALLMDKSGRVRSAAREVVVQADKGFGLRQFYLNRLPVRPAVAILGLGETGNREDCRVIGNFLTHSQPAVVRAVMTALMGLDPGNWMGAVTEQLATDQPGVVKTAALLLARHRDFDQERVFAILQASRVENTKLKCAVLLFRTGKWDRLSYALTLLGGGHEKLDQACRLELMAWIHTYNRSYAALGEEQRRRILALLDEKGAYLHPAVVNQLRFLSK